MSLNGTMSVIEAGSSAVPSRLRNVMSIERRALKACTVSDSPLAGLASVAIGPALPSAPTITNCSVSVKFRPPVVELSEKLPLMKRTVTRPLVGTMPVNV